MASATSDLATGQTQPNSFALGSQEELFVQGPTAGLIISDCRGQEKQRELSYKGPLPTDPRLGGTRALQGMLKPLCASNTPALLIVREGCAKPVQSDSDVIVAMKASLTTLLTSHVSLSKPKTLQGVK